VTNVSDYPRSKTASARLVWTVGTLLFIVALLPRILFVTSGPLQADEKHWNSRTERVLQNFRNDPIHLTSHLGHPGVFPAFVMSVSKVACSVVNRALGTPQGAVGPIDAIGAARIGNALFSSILPPLLFCALVMWTGWFEAFGIALIAALSPRAIDLSRLAHVDTIHAVVVAATVFSYLSALRFNDRRYKAWAGVFFGLCLLTKPTSIALLPALLIGKVLLARLWPQTFVRRGVSWADLWTTFLSLLVFTVLYSRMWHHGETFIEWAAVSHKGSHLVYDIGVALRSGFLGVVTASLVLVGIAVQVLRVRRDEYTGWTWHLVTLALVLLAWLVIFPASWENLIRYWMRVLNLTSVKHQSFAGATPPPPGGYLSYAIAELPPLVFIGLLLVPLLLSSSVRRALRPSEQQLALVSTLVFGCWVAFLSSSPKQSWRYVIAAAPFCYVVAALALCALGRRYGLMRAPIAALVLFQCVAAVQAYPYWDLYQSKLAVVLDPAVRRELVRVRSG
jgi:hypothetical protein